MSNYTCFPCQSEGPALCFESAEMDCEASALAHASDLLLKHRSTAFVTVYSGEQVICSVPRRDARSESAQSRAADARQGAN